MSVLDNVAFGLRMKPCATRPSKSVIKQKVHELLGLVQLDWLADRYPAQLFHELGSLADRPITQRCVSCKD